MINETSRWLCECAEPMQNRGEEAAYPACSGSLSFIALNWASPVSVRSVTSSCSQSCSIHYQSTSKYCVAGTSVFDQSGAEVVACSHTCNAAMLNVPASGKTTGCGFAADICNSTRAKTPLQGSIHEGPQHKDELTCRCEYRILPFKGSSFPLEGTFPGPT